MAENHLPYIPASQGFYDPPMERYLPILPKGIIHSWVTENNQANSLLLDPLGAHPQLPIEAAQSGARIMVARNNPILWLLLETFAAAPSSEVLEKVQSKLLITRRGDETIEDHLRSVYATPCAGCGQMIQPVGYIWEKGSTQPVSRVYTCPHCGDEGEREISEYDLQNLQDLGNLGLHRARALQRVLQGGEYEQESIDAALDCYLPRALYICMTLVNRLERMELDKNEMRLLQAMLLLVFDDATSLWHWPLRDQHYFQLSIPSRFLEKNLWLSLENAHNRLAQTGPAVPVSYWPNLPPASGGICLYQRRLAEKEDLFQKGQLQGIVSIFPRPNQAFWTFSAMWSGWLWGRQAVAPMRSALARRRYDWRWFAQALEAALKDLPEVIQADIQLFGLLSQAAPNHLLGLLTGANAAGFRLHGYALTQADELIQCVWRPNGSHIAPKNSLQSQIRTFLETRGEPCGFQQIINECLAQKAMNGNLPIDINSMEETYFSAFQQQINDILADPHFAQSFQATPTSSVQWWLKSDRAASQPLSERMEVALYKLLLAQPEIHLGDLTRQICQEFPGSLTPERETFLLCLQSYAEEEATHPGQYQLRDCEVLDARQQDISEMVEILQACGKRLGFNVSVKRESPPSHPSENQKTGAQGMFSFDQPESLNQINVVMPTNKTQVFWETEDHQLVYEYQILIACELSKYLFTQNSDARHKRVLVFPGSRSRWLYHRMQQDIRLSKALEADNHLLKFRYLRWLAARDESNPQVWENLLDGDPLRWDVSDQIQLI